MSIAKEEEGDFDDEYLGVGLEYPPSNPHYSTTASEASGSCLRHKFPQHVREEHTTVELFQWLQADKIDLGAEYQRKFVWPAESQTSLVDSILRGAPVNQLMFAKFTENGRQRLRCMDGKQRLTSLQKFMTGEIIFRNGEDGRKYFWTDNGTHRGATRLPAHDRQAFEKTVISCLVFDKILPEEERDIFERVQRGRPLSKAEKLRAIVSARASLVTGLETDFIVNVDSPLSQNLFKGSSLHRSVPFRSLAELVGAISLGKITPMVAGPEKWMLDQAAVPPLLEHDARETLEILELIHQRTHTLYQLAPVEFVVCGFLVYRHRSSTTLARLVDGIRSVTNDVREQHRGQIKMNTTVLGTMSESVATWASEGNVIHAQQGEISAVAELRRSKGVADAVPSPNTTATGVVELGSPPRSNKRPREEDGVKEEEPDIEILDGPPGTSAILPSPQKRPRLGLPQPNLSGVISNLATARPTQAAREGQYVFSAARGASQVSPSMASSSQPNVQPIPGPSHSIASQPSALAAQSQFGSPQTTQTAHAPTRPPSQPMMQVVHATNMQSSAHNSPILRPPSQPAGPSQPVFSQLAHVANPPTRPPSQPTMQVMHATNLQPNAHTSPIMRPPSQPAGSSQHPGFSQMRYPANPPPRPPSQPTTPVMHGTNMQPHIHNSPIMRTPSQPPVNPQTNLPPRPPSQPGRIHSPYNTATGYNAPARPPSQPTSQAILEGGTQMQSAMTANARMPSQPVASTSAVPYSQPPPVNYAPIPQANAGNEPVVYVDERGMLHQRPPSHALPPQTQYPHSSPIQQAALPPPPPTQFPYSAYVPQQPHPPPPMQYPYSGHFSSSQPPPSPQQFSLGSQHNINPTQQLVVQLLAAAQQQPHEFSATLLGKFLALPPSQQQIVFPRLAPRQQAAVLIDTRVLFDPAIALIATLAKETQTEVAALIPVRWADLKDHHVVKRFQELTPEERRVRFPHLDARGQAGSLVKMPLPEARGLLQVLPPERRAHVIGTVLWPVTAPDRPAVPPIVGEYFRGLDLDGRQRFLARLISARQAALLVLLSYTEAWALLPACSAEARDLASKWYPDFNKGLIQWYTTTTATRLRGLAWDVRVREFGRLTSTVRAGVIGLMTYAEAGPLIGTLSPADREATITHMTRETGERLKREAAAEQARQLQAIMATVGSARAATALPAVTDLTMDFTDAAPSSVLAQLPEPPLGEDQPMETETPVVDGLDAAEPVAQLPNTTTAASTMETVSENTELQPDPIIVEAEMPGVDELEVGTEVAPQTESQLPNTTTAALTMDSTDTASSSVPAPPLGREGENAQSSRIALENPILPVVDEVEMEIATQPEQQSTVTQPETNRESAAETETGTMSQPEGAPEVPNLEMQLPNSDDEGTAISTPRASPSPSPAPLESSQEIPVQRERRASSPILEDPSMPGTRDPTEPVIKPEPGPDRVPSPSPSTSRKPISMRFSPTGLLPESPARSRSSVSRTEGTGTPGKVLSRIVVQRVAPSLSGSGSVASSSREAEQKTPRKVVVVRTSPMKKNVVKGKKGRGPPGQRGM
ncbi:DUF262 domain-containing protein [Mycena indigotica]|uniref:DUF262 domain-containing protein n=1 Tax=Mycena indigotica TaxID=2126181 RepID=A0A8H6SM43_9AGAR|nr:DUF262 domain-containing protein [Mycena indigotica]KAF7301849.1 DUF262 domain-containing protein [Mycena indigotica]